MSLNVDFLELSFRHNIDIVDFKFCCISSNLVVDESRSTTANIPDVVPLSLNPEFWNIEMEYRNYTVVIQHNEPPTTIEATTTVDHHQSEYSTEFQHHNLFQELETMK